MFNFLRQERPHAGVVRFRGNIPPRGEEFVHQLERAGAKLRLDAGDASSHWRIKAKHPTWGRADILAPRNPPVFPAPVWSQDLTQDEIAQANAPGTEILVGVEATTRNVLRDRKHLLRYLAALLGDDGLVAYDCGSWRFWAREALADELAHDADLDVESLYDIHGVVREEDHKPAQASGDDDVPEPVPYWIHTHGLDALGAFDLDICGPSEDAAGMASEVLRALAFAIIEGDAALGGTALVMDRKVVQLVPADAYQAQASAADRALRDHDDDHCKKRAVVCEPFRPKRLGLFGGSQAVCPSKYLRSLRGEGGILNYSPGATDLMAERARLTLGQLVKFREEFAQCCFPTTIKAGYATSGSDGGQEHMWFEVEALGTSVIRARLAVKPIDVPDMREGEVYDVPVERLSDWMMMTPLGMVTPRSVRPIRVLRSEPEIVESLAEVMATFATKNAQ